MNKDEIDILEPECKEPTQDEIIDRAEYMNNMLARGILPGKCAGLSSLGSPSGNFGKEVCPHCGSIITKNPYQQNK